MRSHTPLRPGNDLEDRPAWIEKVERGVFYAVVPAGACIVIGLMVGIAAAEVAAWIG